MPKGRGSNKKGGGPTPPQARMPMQEGIPPQVQLLVQKQQIELLVFEKQQAQAYVQQLVQIIIGILLTKRGRQAVLTPELLDKVVTYSGISTNLDDDGILTVTLGDKVEVEDVPEAP